MQKLKAFGVAAMVVAGSLQPLAAYASSTGDEYLGSTLYNFTITIVDPIYGGEVLGSIQLDSTYNGSNFLGQPGVSIIGIGGSITDSGLGLDNANIYGPYTPETLADNDFYPGWAALGLNPYDLNGFSFATGTGGTGYGFRIYELGNDPMDVTLLDGITPVVTGLDVITTFTPVSATPLPATLPLFAGGLGFIGFLSGRRKRKNATTLAAA